MHLGRKKQKDFENSRGWGSKHTKIFKKVSYRLVAYYGRPSTPFICTLVHIFHYIMLHCKYLEYFFFPGRIISKNQFSGKNLSLRNSDTCRNETKENHDIFLLEKVLIIMNWVVMVKLKLSNWHRYQTMTVRKVLGA